MSSKGKKGKTGSSKKAVTKNVDTSKLTKDTRLIPIDEWDWNRVIYSDVQKMEIPDGSGYFRRVYINYMYDDKTIGPAIADFSKHYCFGVQPDNTDKDGNIMKDKETGKEKPLRGYRVPIVMTSQSQSEPDKVTDVEQQELDFLEDWKNEVIRYAVENKKAIGKGGKSDAALESLVGELLYRKKNDDGEPVDGVSPKFYGNLIYFAKKREVGTHFYGPGDKEVDPLKMTRHFHIQPTVRFDSIFVGGKSISLQHRIYDATVEPIQRTPQKRLARPNKMKPLSDDEEEEAEVDTKTTVNNMMESDEEEDESFEE